MLSPTHTPLRFSAGTNFDLTVQDQAVAATAAGEKAVSSAVEDEEEWLIDNGKCADAEWWRGSGTSSYGSQVCTPLIFSTFCKAIFHQDIFSYP